MSLQPWSAVDERAIEWCVPRDESEMPDLGHFSTTVVRLGTAGCASGIAYWANVFKGQTLYIAFDWVEVRQGVPILTDPNAIVTNLKLVDEAGVQISELGHVAQITRMVHNLNWQQYAVEAARKYRLDTVASKLTLARHPAALYGHERERHAREMRKAA